jgi:hypothetical protein
VRKPKNAHAAALAALRMKKMTAAERSRVARIAGEAAGRVHRAKAAARRALKAQTLDEPEMAEA